MLRTSVFAQKRFFQCGLATITTTVAVAGVKGGYLDDDVATPSIPRPNWSWIATTQPERAAANHRVSDDAAPASGATTVPDKPSPDDDAIVSNDRSIGELSLMFPTLEITLRGWRLVKTAILMVLDYKASEHDLTSLFKTTPRNKEEEECAQLRKQAEREVKERTLELERAQIEYTSGPGGNVKGKAKLDPITGEPVTSGEKSAKDQKEAVHKAAEQLGDAEERLAALGHGNKSSVHRKAAQRLLKLCRDNGGTYIKLGQHLANLDYLVPPEYIDVLSSLFDDAPLSRFSDVREVIKEELGNYPEDIFADFEVEPIASASLAQVYVAYDKETGQKLAVKVQHRGLQETFRGDLYALTAVVKAVDVMFKDFRWGWIVEEITPQLPKELDFCNEGRNSEIAASNMKKAGIDCVVPKVHWKHTASRVLCMDFEDGFRVTDIDAVHQAGLKTRDVAKLVSSVFNAQVFQSGFVHCDPHPANVLLRRRRDGKPQVVLIDHGLYRQLDSDFRISYAKLWKALMLADIKEIKLSCSKLGIEEMYPLLAAMLTSRPFDEIIERSNTGRLAVSSKNKNVSADKAMIRGYAQRFMMEILQMLDSVPRQMLLLFKMNDCLRHIDYALGSPTNTLVVAGKYAAQSVYEDEMGRSSALSFRVQNWFSYMSVLFRIQLYDFSTWWSSSSFRSLFV